MNRARREFPGSWKLSNQEANGPVFGVEFPGFSGLEKVSDVKIFVVCAAAIFWVWSTGYRDFADRARGEFPRRLETQ